MSAFTRRYKEHIHRYGLAFIQDMFSNPTHQQDVDYAKLDGAERHTMFGYDKKNRVFVVYSADNDNNVYYIYTRRSPMTALTALDDAKPGYYNADDKEQFETPPEDVGAMCKHMHVECKDD